VALKGDVMKSIGITGVVFAGALLLCSGGAQAADILVKADVPFAFVVNGQPMPAGKYLIQRDENRPRRCSSVAIRRTAAVQRST